MNTVQKGILLLLKSAVTGGDCHIPEDFDLELAIPLIHRHNILTLAYEGAYQCGFSRQNPVMRQMFARYCKALVTNEHQMREVARVCEAFEQEKIDYMPLKGCRLKSLYPRPELRPMGDADILIRTEQYNKIKNTRTGQKSVRVYFIFKKVVLILIYSLV